MEWRDIDEDFVRFFVTKSGRFRSVPLTGRLKAVLRGRSKDAGRVFPGLTADTVTKAFAEALEACGIDDDEAVLHALRHTFASRLVQVGAPIQVVQQMLGHATLTMTMRYAHLAPANTLAAIEGLNQVVASFADSVRRNGPPVTVATGVTSVPTALATDRPKMALAG